MRRLLLYVAYPMRLDLSAANVHIDPGGRVISWLAVTGCGSGTKIVKWWLCVVMC